jgi:polysaccharide export outer membrane protein
MERIRRAWCFVLLGAITLASPVLVQQSRGSGPLLVDADRSPTEVSQYVLGPDDAVRIWVLGLEEIGDAPVKIDSNGFLSLPLVGRVRAGGLTVDQLTLQLSERLKGEIRSPRVSIAIAEFGSQPVAVMGAVNSPGVHQLRGRKTLAEVLALAGGLRADAGYSARITRSVERGDVPLRSAKLAGEGKFWVADVKIKDFLEAKNPVENILIQPHDVVTVPTAEMIYVIGAVRKPGAFVLHELETVSALQALSLAEGLGPTPSPGDSRILRPAPGGAQRTEIPVDLKKILEGRAEDISLRPNDILFVPTSGSKRAAARALEAVIQAGTGVIIWRR